MAKKTAGAKKKASPKRSPLKTTAERKRTPKQAQHFQPASARAVILYSGGLDSTVTLAHARATGYECHALTCTYGQRHSVEVTLARKNVKALGAASHHVVRVPIPPMGSALTSADIKVPKNRPINEIPGKIPITYVPARNTVFLALALSWAETLGANEIFIGANALDYSGYPDCRPEFLRAFEMVSRLGTRVGAEGKGIRIRAPLLKLSKAEIVRKGFDLGIDFSRTHSCYDPDARGRPCGRCDSCRLRLKGFEEAGLRDPLPYRYRPRKLS